MRRYRWSQMVVAAMVGLGVTAGLGRAQSPLPPLPALPGPSVSGMSGGVDGALGPAPVSMPHATPVPVPGVTHQPTVGAYNAAPAYAAASPIDGVNYGSATAEAQAAQAAQEQSKHCLVRWWKNRPWNCWSHHNSFLCSSCESEWRFVFGSCREWWGEPCLKGPPTYPYLPPPPYPPPNPQGAAANANFNYPYSPPTPPYAPLSSPSSASPASSARPFPFAPAYSQGQGWGCNTCK